MTTQADQDFATWLTFHKPQLDAMQLPESLHRKLWQKVTFEDFDIGTVAKILKNENTECTDLMCTKDMPANSDVFLVDHAWTFRFQDAIDTLKKNEPLVERLRKMTEEIEKQDLPSQAEEEEKKAEPAKTMEQAFLAAVNNGGVVFDLDNMNISTLMSLPQFPETIEQLSLFGNEIENPNDIAKKLVPLPNLRALWLNNNPVVDTCSNFSMIGSTMPALEILNSQLTNKAGEWAMHFYAKEQTGAASLAEVEALDLSGKGVLNMPSADVFSHMTKLRKLDLSDHPEFFITPEQRAQMEAEALEGIASKEGVEFVATLITIDDVLSNLSTVEELKCGYQLEEYLCKERANKGYMPKLKLLNGMDASLTEMTERNKIRDAMDILAKLPMLANVYVIGQGIASQPIWYVNDEVGSIVGHSDAPNVRIRSFIHSPTNELNDPDRLEVSIMWPITEIKTNHAFLRDNLQGFTEQKGYRSTRLHSWYDTPTEYFSQQLALLRQLSKDLNVEHLHQEIQDDSPLKGCIINDTNEPIKVFTDAPDSLSTLTDARFQIVAESDQAQIFWLLGANRNLHKAKAIEKEGYLNELPIDDTLLVKDLFLPLVHSSYKCFRKDGEERPETDHPNHLIKEAYMVGTQLPAFVGRFYEKQASNKDNTWAIFGGQVPQGAPIMPCLTQDVDWALRLTEAGPIANIIQKYEENPLLTAAGHKMIIRYSVYIKSVVPLQAFVSKKVQVLNAPKPFTMSNASMGDEYVHLCTVAAPEDCYTSLPDSDDLTSKSVDSIRAILRAFQIQFGEEIKQAGEAKKRAIYSVDVQFDAAKENACVQGFSFAPADNLDYNEAFKALFFDEVAGLVSI